MRDISFKISSAGAWY